MNTTDTSEKGLEALIANSLMADAGYQQGLSSDYDRAYCVDRVKLFAFLTATQPDAVAKLGLGGGGLTDEKFVKRLFDQVAQHGIVDILRKGIKHGDTSLTLLYKQPASQDNPKAVQQYAENIFSVTRQLHYSKDKGQLSLDMVVFLNGLPLITFELKNSLTKQTVKDAMQQYRHDRDPNEPVFGFARCLLHLAVDDAQVYMTTHLRGPQTGFLPFNRGDNEAAGNPLNPYGLKTDYLWKQVLRKDSLAGILEKFAQVIEKPGEDGKKRRELVLPRYHQLDLVRLLLADAKKHGPGKRYLVQHSAGSGKSNSITWLAHQLVELTDAKNEQPVFDSVIVVTDRRVLDKQIRDNIKQFAHVAGVVEAITEGSKQLKKALEENKKIIITTVQKFPFIVNEIGDLPGYKFAIIIDEAHSSQSGDTAAKMNMALAEKKATYPNDGGEEETTEDKINALIAARKMLPNASYFAFTATPKNKTLETFGVRQEDGKFHAHHVYSMRQAIEEAFILDVLQNYTTYNSYYKLLKKAEDDPEFDKARAQKKLKKYVENHTAAVRQKAEVMVDHFQDEVIAKKKIGGQAKAMIVTGGIVSAIRYKHAVDLYLKEVKSPFKAIVAFSGSKEVDGETYDEFTMNGFPSADIPQEFNKSIYRFLIVAEKYQTGFDQPLLHTMYVDKPLADVQAVQTLSRLNRCYPGKTDTFVLDFVNSADAVKEAFDPFYQTAILSEETDLNRLNDLQDKLDSFQVYNEAQVMSVMENFLGGASREQLDPILDACTDVFKNDLSADQQIEFKSGAKSFVRTYQFLASILPFSNTYWESLNTFLKFLVTKLPTPDDADLSAGVLEGVDMDSYRTEKQATIKIQLEGGMELSPTPAEPGGGPPEPEIDLLSNILRSFNERYGTDWTDSDKLTRFLFIDLPEAVSQDEEYQNAKNFSDRQNAKITHEKKVIEKFQEIIFDHTDLYKKFTDNPDFKRQLCNTLFELDYDKISRSPSAGQSGS
ncbi:MAG: type I restriction endonuclease subunit R [Janthinobacterium lividum]